MPRMLDLIRNSEVPSHLMQSAARGSLSLPPGETIEILVHLALHSKLFAEQARLTLAGWDEKASLAAVADPMTSAEVLGYFASLDNLRPSLLPALAENPSVSEELLDALAVTGARLVVEALLKSARVMSSLRLLQALQSNAYLRPNEQAEIAGKLPGLQASPAAEPAETDAPDEVVEGAVMKYLEANAAELAAVQDKPFQPMGMAHEETGTEATVAAGPRDAAASATSSADAAGILAEAEKSAMSAVHAKKPSPPAHEERRESTLKRIARLDIKARIALAMRGTKEERSILIRDSTKLVSLAVLESPKVSEREVEGFAQQKNVLESVLRAIPMHRRFVKNYGIVRNLVYNPRAPLDASLPLMKGLLIRDLKNLSENKEVSDTIRKMALRLYRQRLEKKR